MLERQREIRPNIDKLRMTFWSGVDQKRNELVVEALAPMSRGFPSGHSRYPDRQFRDCL